MAGFVFRVEDEAMSFVDGVEGLVAARVVGLDDVTEMREVSVK